MARFDSVIRAFVLYEAVVLKFQLRAAKLWETTLTPAARVHKNFQPTSIYIQFSLEVPNNTSNSAKKVNNTHCSQREVHGEKLEP